MRKPKLPDLRGTLRDAKFESMLRLQKDTELLQLAQDILCQITDKELGGIMERLNERFIEKRIREIDKKIIGIYRELKLIK